MIEQFGCTYRWKDQNQINFYAMNGLKIFESELNFRCMERVIQKFYIDKVRFR